MFELLEYVFPPLASHLPRHCVVLDCDIVNGQFAIQSTYFCAYFVEFTFEGDPQKAKKLMTSFIETLVCSENRSYKKMCNELIISQKKIVRNGIVWSGRLILWNTHLLFRGVCPCFLLWEAQ